MVIALVIVLVFYYCSVLRFFLHYSITHSKSTLPKLRISLKDSKSTHKNKSRGSIVISSTDPFEGAARMFYQVTLNNPGEFKDVIIHFGDIHGMMKLSGTIEKRGLYNRFENVYNRDTTCLGPFRQNGFGPSSPRKLWWPELAFLMCQNFLDLLKSFLWIMIWDP